eukprot:TRINITY_DN3073_c0_g1_i1.p1 TRINITY_DN3073_c0_g1~~TRINITY_DN3073_c0_g1_i1.p1  ORF type:complete len:327 (-),score=46.86 TRINITY_DN3073_c0_g1_i1:1406-2386(-)
MEPAQTLGVATGLWIRIWVKRVMVVLAVTIAAAFKVTRPTLLREIMHWTVFLCAVTTCDSGFDCLMCHCQTIPPYDPPHPSCGPICGNAEVDPEEECDSGVGCKNCTCKFPYTYNAGLPDCKFSSNPLKALASTNPFLLDIYFMVLCWGLAPFVFLVLAIIVISLIFKYSKRKIYQPLQDNILLILTSESGDKMDVGGCQKLTAETFPLKVTPEKKLTFNLGSHQAPVGKPLQDVITLTNPSSNPEVAFELLALKSDKYEITFEPQRGVVPPRSVEEVTVTLTIHCTTKIRTSAFLFQCSEISSTPVVGSHPLTFSSHLRVANTFS